MDDSTERNGETISESTQNNDDSLTKEEAVKKCKQQSDTIFELEEKLKQLSEEKSVLKEKLHQKTCDYDRIQHLLMSNFSLRDAEYQDLLHQNSELKMSVNSGMQQLKCMSLDPAVNIVFQRLKKEMQECKEKMEQTQNDLQAWKFTPDSQNGKRMMNRIRVLLQENEELGKQNQSGRTAKLETEIALKKTLTEELQRSNVELESLIEEMDSETDGLQNTIFVLQQQLVAAKSAVEALESELETVKPGLAREIIARASSQIPSSLTLEVLARSELATVGEDPEAEDRRAEGMMADLPEEENCHQAGDPMDTSEPIASNGDHSGPLVNSHSSVNCLTEPAQKLLANCNSLTNRSDTTVTKSEIHISSDIDNKAAINLTSSPHNIPHSNNSELDLTAMADTARTA